MSDSSIAAGAAAEADARAGLLTAVEQSDSAAVESILGASPSVAAVRDERGVSVLMLALYRGQDAIVKAIQDHRSEFDVFEAAALGDLPTLRRLCAEREDALEQFSADGFTPLHLAVFFKHRRAVRFMLANGGDEGGAARNESRVQPIHSAAATRDVGMVRMLLAAGADPDAKQMGGHTALHSAVMHDNVAMTTVLLSHGADPSVQDDLDRTASDLAAEAKAARCAALLERFRVE